MSRALIGIPSGNECVCNRYASASLQSHLARRVMNRQSGTLTENTRPLSVTHAGPRAFAKNTRLCCKGGGYAGETKPQRSCFFVEKSPSIQTIPAGSRVWYAVFHMSAIHVRCMLSMGIEQTILSLVCRTWTRDVSRSTPYKLTRTGCK